VTPPRLTLGRWTALMALKDQPELQHRPFAARELKVMHRGGNRRPASGATLDALRSAGWAEKVATRSAFNDPPSHNRRKTMSDTPWKDRPDSLTSKIESDFDTPGFYERYAEAQELVGNRNSKASLVALVAYLLKGKGKDGE